ncbi:hypothetical protein K440DRAFT_636656 [Wilcoxina mikolae CBS 423.85]|nr:hypothetical protein K440DRAFT_636656 [Wilcoxina mikolae CBS 423.85]
MAPPPAHTFLASKGDLVCRPANNLDVAKFFLLNYGLHALTVITDPGSGALTTTMTVIQAVLSPYAGMARALWAITCCARFLGSPQQQTHYAQALCMAAPKGYKRFKSSSLTLHNQYPRPLFNPEFIQLEMIESFPSSRSESLELEIASNYNIIKILASVFQTVYGANELYAARGNQLEKYGYAAYALTVIPYTMMSLVHLLVAFSQPQYSSIFIVDYGGVQRETTNKSCNNPQSEAAVTAGTPAADNDADMEAKLQATVGVAYGDFKRLGFSSQGREFLPLPGKIACMLLLLLFAIPYIIMKLLTNFEKRQGTHSKRTWILVWLEFGQFQGPVSGIMYKVISEEEEESPVLLYISLFIASVIVSVGSFGVFAVVGKMILNDVVSN